MSSIGQAERGLRVPRVVGVIRMEPAACLVTLGTLAASACLSTLVVRQRAVTLMITFVVISFVLPRWTVLAAAIVLVRNWGSGLEVLDYTGPVVATDILLSVWVLRQAASALSARSLSFSPASLWLLAFLAWAWFATFASGITITPLSRVTLYGMVALLISLDRRGIAWVYRSIAVYAVVELLLSWGDLGSASAGVTVGDPHELGMLLIAGAAVFRAGLVTRSSLRWLFVLALLAGALGTTRRAIWFAVAVFLVVGFRRMSPRWLLLTLVGMTALGIALFNPISDIFELRRGSADERLESISRGVAVIEQDPVLGVGWAGLAVADGEAATDPADLASPFNLFVDVGASIGIPGLILLLGYVVSVLSRLSQERHGQDIAAFIFCGTFLALSLTSATVFAGSLVTLLFFTFAGVTSVSQEGRECAEVSAGIASE